MNKIKTLVLILLIPAFVTACEFKNPFAKQTGDGSATLTSDRSGEEAKNAEEDTSFEIAGNIYDLWKQGKNIKCTFSLEDESFEARGTMYMSKEKVRNDIVISIDNTESVSTTLIDGNTIYMWKPGEDKGIKMTIDPAELEKLNEENDAKTQDVPKGLSDEYNYNCNNWVVDDSMFALPENMEFADQSEFLENLQNMRENPSPTMGDSNFCGICNSMENADQIAQCKTQFKCTD